MRPVFETVPIRPGQDLTLVYRERDFDLVLFRDELDRITGERCATAMKNGSAGSDTRPIFRTLSALSCQRTCVPPLPRKVTMATATAQNTSSASTTSTARKMFNKVPEATIFFWVVKIMATTVGETISDYFNSTLGWGLVGTFALMASILVVVMVVQFRLRQYVPTVYWLAVVLISVVGTLITDYLHDTRGYALAPLTIIFSIALAACFGIWYSSEKTLSIHSIHTSKREAFYWLTILCSFALGTASGDWLSDGPIQKIWSGDSAFLKAAFLFATFIALVYFAHKVLGLNAILAFWAAYIVTRPLGASLGDFLSVGRSEDVDFGKGLNLGTTVTSVIFLTAIVAIVAYLTVTKADLEEIELL